ncbi:MAG: hypothetical protein IH946_07320, partial [Bacteroidetes bacterium]|nr:hypothetical protein [Bacteroidota bacterium]
MLNALKEYWQAGEFPKNYDYPGERRPCFIDKDRNICAVGYLVERSVNREFAETINSMFQYDYINSMDLPELLEWTEEHGFTLEEVATIQPTYGPPPGTISPLFGIGSSILNGFNIGFTTL